MLSQLLDYAVTGPTTQPYKEPSKAFWAILKQGIPGDSWAEFTFHFSLIVLVMHKMDTIVCGFASHEAWLYTSTNLFIMPQLFLVFIASIDNRVKKCYLTYQEHSDFHPFVEVNVITSKQNVHT